MSEQKEDGTVGVATVYVAPTPGRVDVKVFDEVTECSMDVDGDLTIVNDTGRHWFNHLFLISFTMLVKEGQE